MTNTGKLIIFNMEEFQQEKVQSLPGNENDVRILKETFEKYNANVECVYKNYTLDQIKSEMKKIERDDFDAYKYLAVAVLTHGDRKEVLLSSDEIFDLDNEIIFPILRNRSLKNKPKLFIIDACKGTYDLIEAETNAVVYETGNDDDTSKPSEDSYYARQIMRCFATSEGFKAFGTEEYGSFFIQIFCNKLKEKGDTESVKKIMEECISEVQEKSKKRQLPTIVHNMTENEVAEFTLGKLKKRK